MTGLGRLFICAHFLPQTTRTTLWCLKTRTMITSQTIRTLLALLELERIEQVGFVAKSAYIALLTAQFAWFYVIEYFLYKRLKLLVVVRLAQFKQTMHWVYVLIVYNEIVKLALKCCLKEKSTKYYNTVPQIPMNSQEGIFV